MSTRTPNDRYLERDGARLRWRMDGAGPTIVLLHGWALDLDCWQPVASLLARDFMVLRHDRRGFGLSSGPPDVSSNVQDLASVMEAAGVGRAVVIGMSQGARLALHFALEAGSRVRALVLDGAPPLTGESDLPLARYRSLHGNHAPGMLQQELLQHPLMQLCTNDASIHALLHRSVYRYRGDDLMQQVSRDQPRDLAALQLPVLVLNGARDSDTRLAAGHALRSRIPGARHAELPDAGHLALLDDAERYAAVVKGFCENLPP